MEFAFWGCFIFIAAAFITDMKSMKIPNVISMSAVVSGLLFGWINGGWEGVLVSIKGMGAGFGILLMLYFVRAVGAGDVKIFAGIGAWTGTTFTMHSFMYSILFAGLIGLVIMLWRREAVIRLRLLARRVISVIMFRNFSPITSGQSEHLQFPFMVAVLPGVIAAYLYV
ncbi:A24 family peptidase [Paenibacillus sediminis]|uniref:Prepilin peptidase CpaA n=1 Tax=Paenibacillus sediminis TaxID=664909 RepID=A0ABS4H4H1_9BACL|nr:A24 family peptidase [Paenibacillus sediminis]MBP1937438.1 prepilin peptidase CpaA [Paenibacillus sediminis]